VTPDDLAAIAALAAAATPGPWISGGFGPSDTWVRITQCEGWPGTPVCEVGHNVANRNADAAFIAAARTAVPALLAHIATLTAERDAAVADARAARTESSALFDALRGTLATPTLAAMQSLHRLGGCWLVSYDDDETSDPVTTIEYFDGARALAEKEGDSPVRWVAIDRYGHVCSPPTAERDAALSRATATEARGAEVRAEGCYILSLRWSRGDALVWWRPYGAGYTLRLDDAGVYSAVAAGAICRPSPEEVVAVPVALAHAECSRVVLDGARHRLLGAVKAALAATGGAR